MAVTASEPDTVQYVFELSVSDDSLKVLPDFITMKHGVQINIGWPDNWVFTFWDFGRSVEQKDVGAKIIRNQYLCCDRFLIPIGVVHKKDVEPGRPHPTVLTGEGGRVYVYDDREDAVYLVAGRFVEFYETGLRKFHPVYEIHAPETPLCEDPVLKRFATTLTLNEITNIRDQMLGKEIAITENGVLWGLFTVCNSLYMGYGFERADEWRTQAGAHRVDVVMSLGRWVEGGWITIPVLCDDTGKIFCIDPSDEKLYFLAASFRIFLRVGMFRFRNNYRYYRGCYSPAEMERSVKQEIGYSFRPTECSRSMFCRAEQKQPGLFARYCGSLKRKKAK